MSCIFIPGIEVVENVYKQKLKEQIERMEKLQDRCGVNDVNEFIELSRQILVVTKKLEELEQADSYSTVTVTLDGKEKTI